MQTNKWIYAAVGAFVLAGLLALVWLGLRASDLGGFKSRNGYEVSAMFSDISGLSSNAKVTMSGMQVGRVSRIGMQHGLWCNPQRKPPGVHHLKPVRVQVQENIATLGVRAVHQRIDQQLAHHTLVIGG